MMYVFLIHGRPLNAFSLNSVRILRVTIPNRLRVRFFGRIRKRICDPTSYGFFDTKETQNPKKDYFDMIRQA